MVQQAAFDRGLKVQGFLEQAVAAYLAVGVPATEQSASAPKVPEGYEILIVPSGLAPILRTLADWIEREGPGPVLDSLRAGDSATPAAARVESQHEQGTASKATGKLRTKHA